MYNKVNKYNKLNRPLSTDITDLNKHQAKTNEIISSDKHQSLIVSKGDEQSV